MHVSVHATSIEPRGLEIPLPYKIRKRYDTAIGHGANLKAQMKASAFDTWRGLSTPEEGERSKGIERNFNGHVDGL
jgi:hypothetical protein